MYFHRSQVIGGKQSGLSGHPSPLYMDYMCEIQMAHEQIKELELENAKLVTERDISGI